MFHCHENNIMQKERKLNIGFFLKKKVKGRCHIFDIQKHKIYLSKEIYSNKKTYFLKYKKLHLAPGSSIKHKSISPKEIALVVVLFCYSVIISYCF